MAMATWLSLDSFLFSVLQLVGLVTGLPRIGGVGPQRYDGCPGEMCVLRDKVCEDDCTLNSLTASAIDLTPNLLVPDVLVSGDHY